MFQVDRPGKSGPTENHSAETQLRWQGAWGISAQRPHPFFGDQIELDAQTVRQTLTTYTAGDRLRLRISNAFGTHPLHIGAAALALSAAGGKTTPTTSRPVTFGKNASVIVPPGATALSDTLHFVIFPGARLATSLFFPEKTLANTAYCGLAVENYLSTPGNYADKVDFPVSRTIKAYPFLVGIDVLAAARAPVIAALGDSITAGHDPDTSWPAALARRLLGSNIPWRGTSVINAGIPGNMLRSEVENPNILARFDRDILALPGITHVILSAGLNDIGRPGSIGADGNIWQGKHYPAQELIAAYRQLIARTHEHRIRIYGCTLTPFGGAFLHSAAKQTIHDEVNAWIRTCGEFDAVIDFADVMADPHNPHNLRDEFDMGDHLHLNESGLRAMADAIDLSLFN